MQNSILVMDSDFLSNWFLTKTLAGMGYNVIRVNDLDTLLKRLAVERFHSVVVRVDVAAEITETTINAVRSTYPDVRVIAYAPYAGKNLRDEFEKENIRYFQHPFRPNEIRQAIALREQI